jgi:glycosyltransferase involved in cell wall biosynthesis
MIKKIGFDATSLTRDHDGGKNQVALNLLRGFEKNGVAGSFVIFCIPEMEEVILKLTPNAVVVPIPSRKIWKKTITESWVRTFILPGYLNKYQIGVLLFPAWNTGISRYQIPTVVIPHDIQTKTHKERFSVKSRLVNAFFCYFDFKLRDRIVAISNFDKQEIVMVYPAYQGKIIQIYNPIFTELFISAGIHRGRNPYITAVNIQHLHKNTITLIKAFDKIKDIIPHDLYLVGRTTAESAHLVSYVNEHALSNRIIFLGFLDDLALAEVLRGSALYVNPSLFEGFGMTAVEAMLSGVPTLVSNVSAVPEVTMGLCNYYEPPDDAGVLADAIKGIILNNEEKDGDYLKIISTKIEDRYNYVKISSQYFDLLTSLMQSEG